jgi:peptide/nickel transport system permease protein
MAIPLSSSTQGEPAGPADGDPLADSATGIEGRSLGAIAWSRLRRDKVAMTGGVVALLLILVAILAPLLSSLAGVNPDTGNTGLIDANLGTPLGGWGGISGQHILGVDLEGRDLFSRVIYGARISLGVAGVSTLVAILLGASLGMIAGYHGGWIDSVISRTMDIMLAFPLLLFAISLSAVLENSAFGLTGNTLHFAVLVFIIGFFSWPYIGRIVRGQTIGLREREFVDAARALGARPSRIIFREILPNLMAPILIYATLLIPVNILFEAALSFLQVGFRDPTPSWGDMINQSIQYYQVDPEYLLVPGIAILLTVLAFNLFGDGLRDAFDPKANR